MERKKITFDSFIRGILVAVVIIGILWLFKRLSSVLLPFFVAWLIAYLIYPLVTFFQHRLRLRNRALAIVCALFSILLVGGLAFYLLVPPMIQEFARVKDLLVGEEQWLKELFEKSIKVVNVKRGKGYCNITLQNESDLTFHFQKTEHDKAIEYFRTFTVKPQSRCNIAIYFPETFNGEGKINFRVTNLLVQPNRGMDYSYSF